MIYSKKITCLKGGSKEAPKYAVLSVTNGLVYRVEIDFPSGSAGLLGVAVLDGGKQIWPTTGGEWFTGDDDVIFFEDLYLKESGPFVFTIAYYNEDTEYSHSFQIRIGMVSKDIFIARFLPTYSYKFFQQMFETAMKQQQQQSESQQQSVLDNPFPFLGE